MRSASTCLLFTAILAVAMPAAVAAQGYTVVGWNNLGMHCMDSSFAVFSILPPYNTFHAQIIGPGGRLVVNPTGHTLSYEAVADSLGSFNSYSSGKTDFWSHVQSLYGVALPAEMGLAGHAMPGPGNPPQLMAFDPAMTWFIGDGIPIVPRDDAMQANPYPMMKLVLRDALANRLAETDIVLPVSAEMDCRACHGSGTVAAARPSAGWVFDPDPDRDYRLNVLRLHDDRQLGVPTYEAALAAAGFNSAGLYPTVVQDTRPILCARCHASNALPGTGIAGISALTAAEHDLHASVRDPVSGNKLDDETSRDACYRCHPGSTTRCLRGAMGRALNPDLTQAMQCQSCHGSMSAVGAPQRVGWLDQPSCQNCHTGTALANNGSIRYLTALEPTGARREAVDPTFATNPDTPAAGFSLYRFSTGHGGLQCEGCHGPTHAEYPSLHVDDNTQSQTLQGHEGMLIECQSCHGADPQSVDRGPHGLHSLSQWWVSNHADVVAVQGTRGCKACHGVDLAGTELSRAQADRSFDADGTPVSFPRGTVVGCTMCHGSEWPTDDVLRSPWQSPLSAVFPLDPYDILPPAPPYVDPQQLVLSDGRLLYYQISSRPRIRMVKTGTSVAIWY